LGLSRRKTNSAAPIGLARAKKGELTAKIKHRRFCKSHLLGKPHLFIAIALILFVLQILQTTRYVFVIKFVNLLRVGLS